MEHFQAVECRSGLGLETCRWIPTRAHELNGAGFSPRSLTATEVDRNSVDPVGMDDGEVVPLVRLLRVEASRAWGMTQLDAQSHGLQSRPLEKGARPNLGGHSTKPRCKENTTYLNPV